MKHLEEFFEEVDFQQTTNSYFIVTSHANIYYESYGFRKNAKFPKRLTERRPSMKLDYLTFLHIQKENFQIFKNLLIFLNELLFLNTFHAPSECARCYNNIVRERK